MPCTRVFGQTAFGNNASVVENLTRVEGETSFQAEAFDSNIVMVGGGEVILPEGCAGQEVTVIAEGGDVTVVGPPGSPLAGQPILIPAGSGLTFFFSSEDEWVAMGAPGGGAAGGPTGPAGPTGPTGATGATGAEGEGIPCEPGPNQMQPEWYIDAINGSDENDGATPATALQTWHEWQCRVGIWTKLVPDGDFMNIHILTDLPIDDPITFKNFIGAGDTVFIRGTPQVIGSGTLTAVVDKDRANNIPNQITDAATDWSLFLDRLVLITSGAAAGSSAWVARDFGAGTAHVTTWMEFDTFELDGLMFGSASPAPGDTYDILDFTHVSLGELSFGADPSQFVVPGPGISSLVMVNLHVRDEIETHMPHGITGLHIMGFSESIFDAFTVYGSNGVAAHNAFRGVLLMNADSGGEMTVAAGLFSTRAGDAGGFRIPEGARGALFGDPTFVGDPGESSLSSQGETFVTTMSVWDSFRPILGGETLIQFGFNDFVTGEFGDFVQLWGDGNGGVLSFFPQTHLMFSQIGFGVEPPLPSIVTGVGNPDVPAGVVAEGETGFFDIRPERFEAHTWDETIAPPNGPRYTVAHPVQWARFDIPRGDAPGDGFLMTTVVAGGETVEVSTASWPYIDFTISMNRLTIVE